MQFPLRTELCFQDGPSSPLLSLIGTPFELVDLEKPLDQCTRKERLTITQATSHERQRVLDNQGRARFHGAFTGGWSAGYYNTVGSKEGFVPATFKSSRQSRAIPQAITPLSLMDDEDLHDFYSFPTTIPPSWSKPTSVDMAQSFVPDFLLPSFETTQSIGLRLLESSGWFLRPRTRENATSNTGLGIDLAPTPMGHGLGYKPRKLLSLSKDLLFSPGQVDSDHDLFDTPLNHHKQPHWNYSDSYSRLSLTCQETRSNESNPDLIYLDFVIPTHPSQPPLTFFPPPKIPHDFKPQHVPLVVAPLTPVDLVPPASSRTSTSTDSTLENTKSLISNDDVYQKYHPLLFAPIARAMNQRFVSSKLSENPLESSSSLGFSSPAVEKIQDPCLEAAKMCQYGSLTRKRTAWTPTHFLCKRLHILNPKRATHSKPTHHLITSSLVTLGEKPIEKNDHQSSLLQGDQIIYHGDGELFPPTKLPHLKHHQRVLIESKPSGSKMSYDEDDTDDDDRIDVKGKRPHMELLKAIFECDDEDGGNSIHSEKLDPLPSYYENKPFDPLNPSRPSSSSSSPVDLHSKLKRHDLVHQLDYTSKKSRTCDSNMDHPRDRSLIMTNHDSSHPLKSCRLADAYAEQEAQIHADSP